VLFNSYEFIFLFVPVALAGYWIAAARAGFSVAVWWLVAASLFFYGWWNPAYLLLLLASIGVNYVLGRMLSRQLRSRAVLAFGIALNLAALFYYKYSHFVLGSFDQVLGTSLDPAPIVLPLAISFFTFQQIAYLVDSYRGLTHEYSFSRYALFVTFFPQLIAGPIVHHAEMLPQFERQHRLAPHAQHLLLGLTIFSIGLFKKIVLADGIAIHADAVFHDAAGGQSPDFFLAWVGALSYTFQLYFDFSGYSDMAVGLAHLFGIRLPINFNSPYKATSIIDFWRRWHMTLSRFLRDYLYIALGGNRNGRWQRYRNLFLTMLLGGIWHGAGWTFVLWGALHGVMLTLNHGWHAVRDRWLPQAAFTRWWYRAVAWALTFAGVVVGWVLFRADSLDTAGRVLAGMVGLNGAVLPLHWQHALGPVAAPLRSLGIEFGNLPRMVSYAPLFWIAGLALVALTLPNLYELTARYRPVLRDTPVTAVRWRWRPTWRWTVATAAAAGVALLNMSNISQFLYFQF
jgi:alginate O-acetyltransferase complex protein AlgI